MARLAQQMQHIINVAHDQAVNEIGRDAGLDLIKQYTKHSVPCPSLNAGLVAKGMSAARVLLSGRVPRHVFETRQRICKTCPHCSIFRGELFCDCCPCPRWNQARLKKKNQHRAHACPANPPKFDEWEGRMSRLRNMVIVKPLRRFVRWVSSYWR